MGGVAPLESSEIAGIVGAFAVMAGILTAVILVFLVRKGRPCNQARPVLSTIWVRKQQNGQHNGQQEKSSNGDKPPTAKGHDVTPAAATAVTVADTNGVVVNGTAYTHQTQDYNEIRGPDIVPNQRYSTKQLLAFQYVENHCIFPVY